MDIHEKTAWILHSANTFPSMYYRRLVGESTHVHRRRTAIRIDPDPSLAPIMRSKATSVGRLDGPVSS